MKTFNAQVRVTLKRGVLDPQGKAIEGALDSLGFEGVNQVRQGKTFDIQLDAASKKAAEESLNAMCEKLLANTVIEDYAVSLD
jgi:phosphoribosylformylglycinamidine synthase